MSTSTERVRKWRAKHPERSRMSDAGRKDAQRESTRKWRDKNRESVQAKGRARHHAKREEIAAKKRLRYATDPTVKALQRKSKGLPEPTRPCPLACESCDGPPNGRTPVLHLDHCHESGKFRGWLCSRCNVSIGGLGDSAAGLWKALDYLLRNG